MTRLDEVLVGEGSWWKWTLDQLAHASLGFVSALPTAYFFDLHALGIGIAFSIGFSREVYQAVRSEKLHLLDRSVDTLFWLIGGLFILFV